MLGKALGAGGGYVAIISFVLGIVFGVWVYSGQIAKRDLNTQKLEYDQKILDLNAKIDAKDLKIKTLEESQDEGATERGDQAREVAKQTRIIQREVEGMRLDLQKERQPYYEIELPIESIDRVNCAFRASLCNVRPSPPGNYPSYQSGKGEYSGVLAGPPRR